MGPALLEARGVRAGYADVDIVRGASLRVQAGELVAVIGPNGAGKSTMLKALCGLLPLRGGQVLLDGRDLAGMAPEALARLGLGYVPQVRNVFPSLTVRENLEMGAYLRREGVRERMAEVVGMFPRLGERMGQRARTLSGGERQMLALGRALMLDPRVLLLDEPAAGLAPAMVDELFARVLDVRGEGVGVLMVEQHARKALARADRAYVLDQGANALEGPGPALLTDPQVGRLYLGVRPGDATEGQQDPPPGSQPPPRRP